MMLRWLIKFNTHMHNNYHTAQLDFNICVDGSYENFNLVKNFPPILSILSLLYTVHSIHAGNNQVQAQHKCSELPCSLYNYYYGYK